QSPLAPGPSDDPAAAPPRAPGSTGAEERAVVRRLLGPVRPGAGEAAARSSRIRPQARAGPPALPARSPGRRLLADTTVGLGQPPRPGPDRLRRDPDRPARRLWA